MCGKHDIIVEHMFFDDNQRARINTGQGKPVLELTAFSVRSHNKRPWTKSEGSIRAANRKRDRNACVRNVENFHQLSDKATDEVLYVFGHVRQGN